MSALFWGVAHSALSCHVFILEVSGYLTSEVHGHPYQASIQRRLFDFIEVRRRSIFLPKKNKLKIGTKLAAKTSVAHMEGPDSSRWPSGRPKTSEPASQTTPKEPLPSSLMRSKTRPFMFTSSRFAGVEVGLHVPRSPPAILILALAFDF